MNPVFRHLNKNKSAYSIAFLFLFAKLLTITNYRIMWWDPSVYVGMGKYIYSLGNAGLWEDSRPIIWPIILGFFWKIGSNSVLIGRVIEIIFGSLCILFIYLIGKKIFNEKIALLSSIFLALSPTFFFFNGVMLTEVVSTFFSLAAIYLFMDKKHFVSGIFFGIAFITRFLQSFVFAALVLLILTYFKKEIRNLKKTIVGFIVPVLLFLMLNHILYNNAFFPFLQQIFLSKNSGWMNYHTIDYYFIELFKENSLYLLSFFGTFLFFRKKEFKKMFIAAAFIIFFVFFNLINQKETRFLIVLFPYMYLLVSHSIFHFLNYFKNKIIRTILIAIIIIALVPSLQTTYIYYKDESAKINEYAILQDKLRKVDRDAKIWISSPVIAAFSDKKIDNLMYYPIFNEKKKTELLSDNSDFIFLNSCDLSCKSFDIGCEKNKDELITNFKKNLKTIYLFKSNSCEQLVFAK